MGSSDTQAQRWILVGGEDALPRVLAGFDRAAGEAWYQLIFDAMVADYLLNPNRRDHHADRVFQFPLGAVAEIQGGWSCTRRRGARAYGWPNATHTRWQARPLGRLDASRP